MSHNTKTLYFKPKGRGNSPFAREFAIVEITPSNVAYFMRKASYLDFNGEKSQLGVSGEDRVKSHLSEWGWVPCSYEEVVRSRLLWNN